MIVQGPTPAIIAPQGTPVPVTQAVVALLICDLVAHTYSISYGRPGLPSRTASGPLTGGPLATIEGLVQQGVEIDQGWPGGSSVVVTP